MPEPEVKSVTRGRWTRVFIAQDGKDVSHLNIVPRPFHVGPAVQVRMAGIAGVATQPEYRRRGYARRVFSQAMQQIRQQGYSCAGLYTGADIVAHRLYRRFGFVDVLVHRYPVKVLDMPALVARRLAGALRQAAQRTPALSEWRCLLAIELPGERIFHLHIESAEVRVLPQKPRKCDLTVTASRAALLRLCLGAMTIPFAQAAGMFRWRGDDRHWQTLLTVLGSPRSVINEGET
jgi:predicted N-acetyltransferase YhbS